MASSGSNPGGAAPGSARPGYPGTPAAAPAPVPQVVNQWAGTVTQNPVLGPSLPVNATCNVPLTPASSVGSGSGTPAPGNWLFCLIGWNQDGVPPATLANVSDDTHMWWRPASPSSADGNTRTVCWFQPNIGAGQNQATVPTMVYVAPGGYMNGMSVLVVEVSGLGPWDDVEDTNTAYADDATSIDLAAGGSDATNFFIGAVTGDSASAGTAFAPSGWTALETVTATNGTDDTGDTVLAAACVAMTGAASVTGSASTAENLSGFLISVLQDAPSPVPEGQNPYWPTMVFEAGFGSGYLTPPDEITWTQLLPDSAGVARLRSWGDSTGTQYELDQIETSETSLLLDNPDAALSPDNPASPWYPDVLPGTPVRLRAIPPPACSDYHWYVFQRYAERWPQSWESILRGKVEFTGNDPWQSTSKEVPTAYRAEVIADGPALYVPCDDPAVIPQPASLTNAAPGNTTPLDIVTSPAGLSVSLTGQPFSTDYYYSATETFADASQWMYGDPDSAGWTQAGAGDSQHGRYLSYYDADGFAPDSEVTVECWVNPAFYATGSGSTQGPYTQPDGALFLWQLCTDDQVLAALVIAGDGGAGEGADLYLITFVPGLPPYPSAILVESNVRGSTWLGITVTLNGGGYQVWVNGGVAATASGESVLTGNPVWLFALGGVTIPSYSPSGPGTVSLPPTADTINGICNATIAHLAVYPYVLPEQRVMAHFMAAYTGFGQLPAPSISGQYTATQGASTYGPDGNTYDGDAFTTPGYSGYHNLAAVACAVAGDYTSYVAAPESITPVSAYSGSEQTGFMWLTADVPAAPAYAWYTSQGAGGEKLAATTIVNHLYVDSFGSGASPPAEASALGDTVQQRIERLLVHGLIPGMARAIDPASSPVVAALDTGGQACGANITNITASDGGQLFMDNLSVLCYWDKPHLEARAALPAMWVLGMDLAAGEIPYLLPADGGWDTDPQRVLNDIAIEQYNVSPNAVSADNSGTGETQTIPGVTYSPAGTYYDEIIASQQQNGPKQVQNGSTSYLQSGASIQNFANWLFETFGTPQTRITGITVDAAPMGRTCPQAWTFWMGANQGDLIQVTRQFPGQPSITGTWIITKLDRKLTREGGQVSATIEVQADISPGSYWS